MTTHPPKPPFLTPYINKKGVILHRIKACIYLSTDHFRIAISRGVVGQKLICTRSCTDHLNGAQAQPNPLPKYIFTSVVHLYMLQHMNCKFGIICW